MPFLSLDLEPPQLGVDMTLAPSRTSPYSGMAVPVVPVVPVVQKGAPSADEIASFIVRTHRELCALESYEPGELVNELLTNLVAVCSEVHDHEITRQVRGGGGGGGGGTRRLAHTQSCVSANLDRSSAITVFSKPSRPYVESARSPSRAWSPTGPAGSSKTRIMHPRRSRRFPTTTTTRN